MKQLSFSCQDSCFIQRESYCNFDLRVCEDESLPGCRFVSKQWTTFRIPENLDAVPGLSGMFHAGMFQKCRSLIDTLPNTGWHQVSKILVTTGLMNIFMLSAEAVRALRLETLYYFKVLLGCLEVGTKGRHWGHLCCFKICFWDHKCPGLPGSAFRGKKKQTWPSLNRIPLVKFGWAFMYWLNLTAKVTLETDYWLNQSWALAVFFNIFNNEKLYFCIFYQVNFGDRLFK